MAKFDKLVATAVPFLEPNINTDRIIPGEWMMRAHTEGFSAGLFGAERYLPDGKPDPGFILHREPWSNAKILLGGPNFGCGSTREEAPLALHAFGITCLIAPTFANVFFTNCFRIGILPIELPAEHVDGLAREVDASGGRALITVDLAAQTVSSDGAGTLHFRSPPRLKQMLMLGVDEIGLTLSMQQQVDRFRAADAAQRPWAYGQSTA